MSEGFAVKRDLCAGALMIAIGAGSVMEGRNHTVGTLTEMGSGYFPIILGVVLACIGIAIALAAVAPKPEDFRDEDEGRFQLPDLRGTIAIVASVAAFIALGDHLGLAPATFVCVFVAASGDRRSKPLESLLLAAALTAVAVGLFAYLLKVPFPVWQWDFG